MGAPQHTAPRSLTLLAVVLLATAGASPARAQVQMVGSSSHVTVGAEGFRDVYRERAATVDTHTDYRSITAGYEYDKNRYVYAVDGRYSKGYTDYKSLSGALDHIPDREAELRAHVGVNFAAWHGTLMPYIGAGWRWYFDNGKGLTVTNNGVTSAAYDRHIWQLYVPIGVTYRYTAGLWTFAPNIEVDPVLLGRVTNHFGFTGFDEDVTQNQHNGYGIRGEFMVGQKLGRHFSWEAGPFVRWWHMSESRCVGTPVTLALGECWIEPNNTRLQYGGALRVKF